MSIGDRKSDHTERHGWGADVIQRHDVCVHNRIQSQFRRRRNKPHSFPVRQNGAVRRHRRCAMRQPLQQYRRRIPHEYRQLKLRRLGNHQICERQFAVQACQAIPARSLRSSAALRAVLKSVTKYTNNTGNSSAASAVTATTDYFFPVIGIRSIRVYHLRKQQRSSKQAQYSYYSAGNSKVKYNNSATSTAVFWWLRSPDASGSTYFVRVILTARSTTPARATRLALPPAFVYNSNSSLAPSMGAQAAGGHEMSVPKSRRGESPAEYINLAREIYVFTYNRVRILPKSYTFYFLAAALQCGARGVPAYQDGKSDLHSQRRRQAKPQGIVRTGARLLQFHAGRA